MPPLPPLPLTAKFTLFIQVAGGPLCNTSFYMKYTGALSQTDSGTLLNALSTSWLTHWAPLTTPQYSLSFVRVIDMNSASGVVVQQAAVHPGSAAGNAVTAGVALVLSAKIAFRYRGGHPRIYVPGMSESNLSDQNTWAPTFLATAAAAWTSLQSDLAGAAPVGVGSMSPIAWHTHSSNKADFPGGVPTTKPPWPIATPVPHPITSWATNPQVASQRRRNQQGGG